MLNEEKQTQLAGCIMADKDLDSRMTEIETEFKNMSEKLGSIAADIKQVLNLTTQVSVISERQTTHQADLNRAFDEIRQLKTHHTDYDKEQDDRIKIVEGELQTIDKEVQALNNKSKTGLTVFLFMYAIVQGLIAYGGKILVDEVRQQHDQVIQINAKLPK